jgi:hypothetical protein
MGDKPNKWTRGSNPPPPLFLGEPERDLVKQINTEVAERVVGQQVLYYPISMDETNFHPLYGEAIVKNFLAPVRVYVLLDWQGAETTTDAFGIDRRTRVNVHFHRRRLVEDQDLWVQEGDFIRYGGLYYEITELNEPRELFGQVDHKLEISAKCIRARDGMFNAE